MFIIANNNISNRHNYKYFAIVLLFFIVIFFVPNVRPAYADEVEKSLSETIESQLEKLDLIALERYLSGISSNFEGIFNGSFVENIRNIISGQKQFDYSNFFSYVLSIIFDDLIKVIPMLSAIVAICVVCSLLGQLSPDKQGEKISKVIYFACFALVATIIFSAFKSLLGSTTGVLESIKTQMQLIFPIILTLITSIGSVVTVSTFKPAVALLSSSIVSMISSIILPIFIFSFIFNIVGNMSSNVKLEKCAKFLSSMFKWLLGTIFTVFMTVLSLQGILASVSDNISIKTAKFALKSYVPLIGNFMSDGLGFILASGVLIKNAVGLTGLFLLLSTIVMPLVEIIIFMLGLKLVAAIVEPLSNNNMSNFIYGCSKCLSMLIACILAVGFMYILSVGLLMCTSNIF